MRQTHTALPWNFLTRLNPGISTLSQWYTERLRDKTTHTHTQIHTLRRIHPRRHRETFVFIISEIFAVNSQSLSLPWSLTVEATKSLKHTTYDCLQPIVLSPFNHYSLTSKLTPFYKKLSPESRFLSQIMEVLFILSLSSSSLTLNFVLLVCSAAHWCRVGLNFVLAKFESRCSLSRISVFQSFLVSTQLIIKQTGLCLTFSSRFMSSFFYFTSSIICLQGMRKTT